MALSIRQLALSPNGQNEDSETSDIVEFQIHCRIPTLCHQFWKYNSTFDIRHRCWKPLIIDSGPMFRQIPKSGVLYWRVKYFSLAVGTQITRQILESFSGSRIVPDPRTKSARARLSSDYTMQTQESSYYEG